MGLKGVGSEIGRGIARYAEAEAKRQRAEYRRTEYWHRLSENKKQNVRNNIMYEREHGDLLTDFEYGMALAEELPKIHQLDLRAHR